ncbi:hypothetical protein L1887_32988 [Cichorium endivia]|nr:hypothetical protein L1887_32988 [Cichorium endivia]
MVQQINYPVFDRTTRDGTPLLLFVFFTFCFWRSLHGILCFIKFLNNLYWYASFCLPFKTDPQENRPHALLLIAEN